MVCVDAEKCPASFGVKDNKASRAPRGLGTWLKISASSQGGGLHRY